MKKIKEIWKIIKSQRVNVKMIPVKVFGSFLYLATLVTFPYLTLQMLNIGLTMSDVSIIYGIVPIMTFMTSPLAGKDVVFIKKITPEKCLNFAPLCPPDRPL